MNVLDMLGSLLPTQAGAVASQVGATPEQTQTAMQASVPLILQALHQNTQTEGGEAALSSALEQHDGSSLDNFAQGQLPSTQDGSAILDHAFGDQAPQAANVVAQHAGIDPQMATQIMSMVAPLVLGALGRGQSGGGATGGLGGMLGGLLGGQSTPQPAQNQANPQGSGDLGGLLGSVNSALDKSGEGNVLNDVMGMFGEKK